jgi:hypothetical protein
MNSFDFPQTSSLSSTSQGTPNDELIVSLMSQSAKETEAIMQNVRENWAQDKNQRDKTDKHIVALATGVSTTTRNYRSFHTQGNEEVNKTKALEQQITQTSHLLTESEQRVIHVEQLLQGVEHTLKKDDQKMDQIDISLDNEKRERAKLNQELQDKIQNNWRLRAQRALDSLVEKVCSCFRNCLKGTVGIAAPTVAGSLATGFTSGTNNGFAAGAGGGFLLGSAIVFTCCYNKKCRKACCSD